MFPKKGGKTKLIAPRENNPIRSKGTSWEKKVGVPDQAQNVYFQKVKFDLLKAI